MKPMLFNTEMVRAILDGRKTVTRRVVKPQPKGRLVLEPPTSGWPGYFAEENTPRVVKPPYFGGDILYVRETWYYESFYEDNDAIPPDLPSGRCSWRYEYKATSPDYPVAPGHWCPSIHMPKEAARLFLRVKAVRVERLHDMTANSAMDEGFTGWNDFVRYWDSTIKPADRALYGWAADPWVWVIEFERIGKEEALK